MLNENWKREIEVGARKYIDAVHHFDEVGRDIRSVLRLGIQRRFNANNSSELEQIKQEERKRIDRSLTEAQKRISQPILDLNNLVQDLEESIYFSHNGQDYKLIRVRDKNTPHQNFSICSKDGENWKII